jgi:hypothetical protein
VCGGVGDVFVGACVRACVRACVCSYLASAQLRAKKSQARGRLKTHSLLVPRVSKVETPVRVLALLVNIGYGRYSNEFRYDGNSDWRDGGGEGAGRMTISWITTGAALFYVL